MKIILVVLLLVSTGAIAQVNPQLLYAQQQYNYDYDNPYQSQFDDYDRMEQQRQLQQEFLDEQYANQQDLMNQQPLRMEVDRMEPERKRDRSTFPGW